MNQLSIQEMTEELWDRYSQSLSSDIDHLSYYAGRSIMTEESFRKAMEQYANQKQSGVEWQLCPKCLGQGNIGFPPGAVPGSTPLSTSAIFECDVCNGQKIIPKFYPSDSDADQDELYQGVIDIVKRNELSLVKNKIIIQELKSKYHISKK